MFMSCHQQPNRTGNRTCRSRLLRAPDITYHNRATIKRGGKKEFCVAPRSRTHNGSGLEIDVRSHGDACSRAELVALVKYTGPSTKTYCVAVTQLLKKVPKRQCVVHCEPEQREGRSYQDGERVNIHSGRWNPDSHTSMYVRKLGSTDIFEISSEFLRPITGQVSGVHAVMKYCGDYMEHGHTSRKDCTSDGYNILNEYEAVDPSNGIKAQVCLVPDHGGSDSLSRQRYFWNLNLYGH